MTYATRSSPLREPVFPGVHQFVCHYHFAADVGKDILSSHVDLSAPAVSSHEDQAETPGPVPITEEVCRRAGQRRTRPQFHLGSAVDQQSSQPLDSRSRQGCGSLTGLMDSGLFPQRRRVWLFPSMYRNLTLYDRILEVGKVLREVSANWSVKKRGPLGTLRRLKEILDIVVASKHTAELRTIVAEMKRDQRVFEQLRDALRICPKGGTQRRNDGASNLSESFVSQGGASRTYADR